MELPTIDVGSSIFIIEPNRKLTRYKRILYHCIGRLFVDSSLMLHGLTIMIFYCDTCAYHYHHNLHMSQETIAHSRFLEECANTKNTQFPLYQMRSLVKRIACHYMMHLVRSVEPNNLYNSLKMISVLVHMSCL